SAGLLVCDGGAAGHCRAVLVESPNRSLAGFGNGPVRVKARETVVSWVYGGMLMLLDAHAKLLLTMHAVGSLSLRFIENEMVTVSPAPRVALVFPPQSTEMIVSSGNGSARAVAARATQASPRPSRE